MKFRPALPHLALAASSLLLVTSLHAADPAPKAPRPILRSTVFDWEKLTPRPTPVGERRDVADNPTTTLAVFECHVTTLNPGQASHAPHRHPQEELIVVKEGTLEVHLNGETQRAGPGSTFFYASNDAHAVRNVGETRATYWVINLATEATHDPAKHNPNPKLRSHVYDYEKLTARPTRVGESRAVFNGSTATLATLQTHITSVRAGEASHAAHRHPDDEVVLVREGTLEVTINDVTHRAGPGSILFFASNDLHGMRNIGTTTTRYHVVRMVTAATPQPAPAANAAK